VFTVVPERQQELVDLLVEATEQVMVGLPGFVSANIHRSDDGTRVVNYAQWRSRADFAAMRDNPTAGQHMGRAAALASFDPIICEVASVHHA
jgi:heme-degrading monooxygenase HmoA